MSVRFRAVLGGVVLALVAAPAADARVQADAAADQLRQARFKLRGLSTPPQAVVAGSRVRMSGRVANRSGRLAQTGRVTFSLRTSPDARRGRHLRGVNVKRTKRSRSRRFSALVRIPGNVAPGRYYLRTCVRRGSGTLKGHCRSKRVLVTAGTAAAPAPQGGLGAAPPRRAGGRRARARRPARPGRRGGAPGPPEPARPAHRRELLLRHGRPLRERPRRATTTAACRRRPGRVVAASTRPRKGCYHGGDLKGLLDRIDYIQGLGTTAIWLTPSFKNKAVQPEDNSAGYHGYWITDFTQIDPHLGTNAELQALVDAAHARGMKVYFDIITNHTADVIDYAEGSRPGYVSKDERALPDGGRARRSTTATTRAAPTSRRSIPRTSFPFTPFNPAGQREPARSPTGSTT